MLKIKMIIISTFMLVSCGPIGPVPDPDPSCEQQCKDIASPEYPYNKCVSECEFIDTEID